MKDNILQTTVVVLVVGLFLFGIPFIWPLLKKGMDLSYCAGAELAGTVPFKHANCGGEKRK